VSKKIFLHGEILKAEHVAGIKEEER